MIGWYSISALGWLVTVLHTALTSFVVKGVWFTDHEAPEYALLEGALLIYLILLMILIYAKLKRMKIFARQSR